MRQTTRFLLIALAVALVAAWIFGTTRLFGQDSAAAPKAVEAKTAPKPIADAEARKVRELQLAIAETQNRLLQLERQFKTEQASLQTATKELDGYLDSLQAKYAAKDHDLDQQLTWQKKKK